MDNLLTLFNVNTTFFTIIGYPMSYIEFFGTLLNILAVYLVARNNIWNWLVGSVAAVLFGILFFQIQLYSDFFEQIYYFITGFVGWWLWKKKDKESKTIGKQEFQITQTTLKTNIIYLCVMVIGTAFLGWITGNVSTWLPQYFPEPASYPYLDSATTVMSFAATILMMQKKIENWYLWILVDIIGIWLYYTKGVVFVSLLYVVFLVLATQGYFNWRKIQSKQI
jgi:nicotinamide mononucleotide transporter